MVFKDKKQLSIIEVDDRVNDRVSFEELASLLINKPSNMVYCTKAGKLYGIISMGDVHRTTLEGRRHVEINKTFTYLRGFEYIHARKLFLENNKINALPIIDEDNNLLGDYSRWDDAFSGYCFDFLKGNIYSDIVWKKYRNVAIVKPSCNYALKEKLLQMWYAFFMSVGIEIEIIQKQNIIEAFNEKDLVFFTDEDEIRGLGTLFEDILDKDFDWSRAKTLEAIGESVGDAMGENIIRDIMNSGVYVMTLQIKQKGDYWKNLYKEIQLRWNAIKRNPGHYVPDEFWEDFYDDLFTYDYASRVSQQSFIQLREGLTQKLKDTDSTFYNVKNGNRITTQQPQKYNKTIYFFGPCLMVGAYSEDKYTIESILQKILIDNGYNVRVVNCGCWSNEVMLLFRMLEIDFKMGDIAIIYDKGNSFDGIPNLNLGKTLEKHNAPAQWFLDCVVHTNHKGNELFAKEIYSVLPKCFLKEKAIKRTQKTKDPILEVSLAYIERYFPNYVSNGDVGSIVMNCNPFTLGHRYLIEEASKKVDILIIFVVEEDKSMFTFRERFAMVVEGTKDIDNVIVVPSGDLILSRQTFPEYFIKVEDEDTVNNAEFDIRLFAKNIAPKLNITYRFVGEEKSDTVTAEYNYAMKKILPQNGIEVVEIPRKEITAGTPISATKVRELLEKMKFDEVKKLVPQTTFNILMKSWNE